MKHPTHPSTYRADLDELVFRARNKAYGAYPLRKRSNLTTLFALTVTVVFFAAVLMLPKLVLGDSVPNKQVPIQVVPYELLPPPPVADAPTPLPATQALPPPPVQAAVEFKAPEAVEDQVADLTQTTPDIPTILDDPRAIGRETTEGEGTHINWNDLEGKPGPSGPIDLRPQDEVPSKDTFIVVDEQPLPVNMDQFRTALGYPSIAKEARIEGTVVVRILVSKTGRYEQHAVLRSPHPALTKAVEDQLALLRFTPGIQAGKPIRVWVNIPVRFRLHN